MKYLIGLLDLILSIFLAVIILPAFALYLTVLILFRSKPYAGHKIGRNLLRLVPANLQDLIKKGVSWMIFDTDENGYFNHVYTLHFPSPASQKFILNEHHSVIELGKVAAFLKKAGFYYLFGLINIVYFLFRISQLRKFVKNNIDVIRGQDPHYMGLAALLLSKLTGIAYCISIHGNHEKLFEIDRKKGTVTILGSRKIIEKIERLVLSQAKLVMPIRETLREYALKYGTQKNRIRIIPHGIHMEKFFTNINWQIEKKNNFKDKKLIVFVGRLTKVNYVEDVIKIAKEISKRLSNILFLLIGDGDCKNDLIILTKRLGIEKYVLFLGYQPFDRVINYRLMADVNLCLMGGFSLIEAAAAGRPIVAYDVDWHSELIINNKTGYLVKEHDIDEASRTIVNLINNPELARRIGENVKKSAIEKYSFEKASEIKKDCYKELLLKDI